MKLVKIGHMRKKIMDKTKRNHKTLPTETDNNVCSEKTVHSNNEYLVALLVVLGDTGALLWARSWFLTASSAKASTDFRTLSKSSNILRA